MTEQRFRAFFEHAPLGMLCIDLNGQIIEANPRFWEMLAMRAVSVVNPPFQQYIHPDDVGAYERCFAKLVAGEISTFRLEQRILDREAQACWVAVRATLVREGAGNSPYVACMLEDVNHRRQLERSLRQQVERERLITQFTRRIRQSLDVNTTLTVAVDEIRGLLDTDRILIYQFDADYRRGGWVVNESVGEQWRSLLGMRLEDPCLNLDQCLIPYLSGHISVIPNIYEAGLAACYVQLLAQFEVMSNVVIPILQESRLWGLLAVQHCRSARDWAADELTLLQRMTDQIAIALTHSELLERVQREVQQQRALNQLSQAIFSTQDLDALFTLALGRVLDFLGADQVSLCQYRRDRDLWLCIAEERRADTLDSILGCELLGAVHPLAPWLTQPQVVTIDDSRQLGDRAPHPMHRLPGAWLFAPLVINQMMWGSLNVYKARDEPYHWSVTETEMIQAVGQQLVIALQQGLIYRQVQQHAEQQSSLNRVISAIRESLNLAEIFARAAEEIYHLLRVERILIAEHVVDAQTWIVRVDYPSRVGSGTYAGLEIPDGNNPLTAQLKRGEVVRFSASGQHTTEVAQVLTETFPGAWLMVPLQVKGQTWGFLDCIQKDDWQDWQEAVAQAIADKLAIAIQQSILYQQLQEANRSLQDQAMQDGLTQIPNRRYFDEYFRQEWLRSLRERQALSLILCDVDFFKPYNDTYGHQAGDDCLIRIAHTLGQTVRRSGDVVARYGGEEFAIILPNTSTVGATRIAEDIQGAIAALKIPHAASTVSPYITLSLGIASLVPTSDISAETLIQSADQALYQAKRTGRDRYCIHTLEQGRG